MAAGAVRKKRAGRRKAKLILFGIELIVIIVMLVVLYLVLNKSSEGPKVAELDPQVLEIHEEVQQLKEEGGTMQGYRNIALFGLDNRSNGNLSRGNSDVIMIASIDNNTHDVKLVSVYRDSYLNIGNDTYKKCNAAYASGGPEQAISMLNTNLDLNITDYVTVDFNAIVECVDLLGGVEVTVTDEEAILMEGYMDEINKLTKRKESEYSEYLPGAGTYNMDGVQACSFARIRYTTGDDYKRAER